jgi:hypothetical protein
MEESVHADIDSCWQQRQILSRWLYSVFCIGLLTHRPEPIVKEKVTEAATLSKYCLEQATLLTKNSVIFSVSNYRDLGMGM